MKIVVKERIKVFELNPSDLRLRNHPLKGKLKGYRSINITGDWRAIYFVSGEDVIFAELGRHSELYK